MEDSNDVSIGPEAYTFKDLVMRHLYRVSKLYCCELRGGYYTTKRDKQGAEIEIYIEDTREALSNGILFLAQLLMSKFDKQMKTKFDEFEDSMNKEKQAFLKKTKINDTQVLGEGYYDDAEKKLLEEFKIKKLHIFEDLFTQLSLFLGRKNFLEIGGDIDKDEA